MRFPNAAAGVKKIFTAEILSLIAGFATVLASIGGLLAVAAATAADSDSDAAAAAGLAGAGVFAIFGIAAAILLVIAFILQLVGINKAKADEPAFKTALIFIFVGIAATLVGGFINNDTVKTIFDIISSVASLCVTLYIIQGIKNLADRLNDGAVSAKGNKIFMLIAIMYAIKLLASIIALFAPTVAGILGLVAAIVGIVQYIIFLTYLSQAKKMLAA
jgi:uncharacterized protein with PQ loop repeat